MTVAKRSKLGLAAIGAKRSALAVRLRRFLTLFKSHGRQLAELIAQDDEDVDVSDSAEWGSEIDALDAAVPGALDQDTELDHEQDEEWADELDEHAVENTRLPLPSNFSAEDREDISALRNMVERERQIRRAHLDARKKDLSLSLRVFGVMLREAKRQGTTTRSKAAIERQKQNQMKAVKSYQQHQTALESLGMTKDDESRYPPLTWDQLLRHRPFRNKARELGEGRASERGPLLPWLMMDLSCTETAEDSEQSKESLIRSLSTDGKH